jgi:SH3-like domain-containing protein
MVANNAMRHKRHKTHNNNNNALDGQYMKATGPLRLASFLVVGLFAFASAGEGLALERGPVTNLPLPRFVSLKTGEGNVRRGPSLTHRIDWVFTRRGMPLEIIGEFGHWRRVRDRDGVGGWVHYTLLSGARTGLVEADLAALYARADQSAPVNARLEAGVIVSIDNCAIDWCRVHVEGVKGWMVKSAFWGVRADEVFD